MVNINAFDKPKKKPPVTGTGAIPNECSCRPGQPLCPICKAEIKRKYKDEIPFGEKTK